MGKWQLKDLGRVGNDHKINQYRIYNEQLGKEVIVDDLTVARFCQHALNSDEAEETFRDKKIIRMEPRELINRRLVVVKAGWGAIVFSDEGERNILIKISTQDLNGLSYEKEVLIG